MLTLYTKTRSTSLYLSTLRQAFGELKEDSSCLMNEGEYNELLGYLSDKRESNHHDLVSAVRQIRKTNSPVTYKEREPYDSIVLKCLDGEMDVCRSYLGYFVLLRDYFEEYPDEVSIDLPFSRDLVAMSLSRLSGVFYTGTPIPPLLHCYNCVRYLNPVSNTYPLAFSLEGMSASDMKGLAATFTVEERRQLKTIYRKEGVSLPLPYDGEGHFILACSGHVRADASLCVALFSESPSWLTCHLLCHCTDGGRLTAVCRLIEEADFSDEYFPNLSAKTRGHCYGFMVGLLSVMPMTWDKIARFLAMMGIRSKELLNDNLAVCAPYGVLFLTEHSLHPLDCMRRAYPGTWQDAYLIEAVNHANASIHQPR